MQFIPSPRCREATVSLHCVCFSTRPRYLVPNWVHQRLFFFLTLSRVITQRNNKAAAVAAVALESSVILKGFFFFFFSFCLLSAFRVCVCVFVCLSRSPFRLEREPRHFTCVPSRKGWTNTHTHTHTKERQKHWICRAPKVFSQLLLLLVTLFVFGKTK